MIGKDVFSSEKLSNGKTFTETSGILIRSTGEVKN